MELLFIGVACSEKALIDSFEKYYGGVAQVRPQQYFDLALTKGLAKQCNVTTLTLPPVASYPKSSSILYKRKKEKVLKSLEINYITLLNLPIIKTINIIIQVFFQTLLFLIKNRKKDHTILCGYISFETTLPAILIAKIFNIRIFSMVPDAPLYISTYSKVINPIKRIINKLTTKINRQLEDKFDGYVFITQAMSNLINRNQKPYIVVEGMISEDNVDSTIYYEKKSPKIIMYAGTLHEKFGIKKMVDAFIKAELQECELWVYGMGDYAQSLNKIAEKYSNVKYKGSVSKSEILDLEKKATLLVNPRPSKEKFTEYSFPSKTLEYMASGTPLLTTKLRGIPNEYDNYLYYFFDESTESIANRLKEIMCYPPDMLNKFGDNAKRFVLENKNYTVQTKKIYDFLEMRNK